jgi:hypothetical protein
MKLNFLISGLAIMACVVSAPFFFSSCHQEDAFSAPAQVTTRSTAPEVPSNLEVGEGYEVSYHTYARGVQVYVCRETYPDVYAWVFKEPIATLYKDANYNAVVGTHYAGPTWESNSGSTVVAARLEGATVDPTAIPWLKLGAVTTTGPGIFEGTTHIQRVNTVGGKAPATGAEASTVGMEIHVPYTAEYYFYKPE